MNAKKTIIFITVALLPGGMIIGAVAFVAKKVMESQEVQKLEEV